MKTVIGLVGEKGSGKETFGKFLREQLKDKKVIQYRFSDLLKETLIDWSLPITRENLQLLAQIMEKSFGSGTVANAVSNRIDGLDADIVLLDGVRWESDRKLVRSFENNWLVYITAELLLRYERLKQRGEKTGEESTSYDQFLKEEQAENEIYIPEIGATADFKINNNGTLEELKQKAQEFCQKFI